jgi:hypothetical protein
LRRAIDRQKIGLAQQPELLRPARLVNIIIISIVGVMANQAKSQMNGFALVYISEVSSAC